MSPWGSGSRLARVATIVAVAGICAFILQVLVASGVAVPVTKPLFAATLLLFLILWIWAAVETNISRARRSRDRARRIEGKCIACGYDLTGNASGICPECGRPTPASGLQKRAPPDADYARAGMVGFAAATGVGLLFAIFATGTLCSIGIAMSSMCGTGVLACGLHVWFKRSVNRVD